MFSKTTEYALRAMIYIAQNGTEQKKLSLDEIAGAIDSPASFTAKILQTLTGEGKVLSSVRGPNGGFFLTQSQMDLPIKAILRATGEEDRLMRCVLGLSECMEVRPCPMHNRYKSIKAELVSMFEDKTIGQLVQEMDDAPTYIRNRKKNSRK